jgi:multicomponent Na+:H+ antiporter subunit D
MEHLPVLVVLVPFLSAPACVLLRHPRAAAALSLVASWVTFALATALLLRVLERGTIRYAIGDWIAPWGIEYRVDPLSALVILLVAGVGAIVIASSPRSLANEISRERHYLFHAAYLLATSGLLGIAATGDLFNLFVFLEISSISSYALISLGPTRRALTASFRYLILGTIGATFVVIGIGLAYMATGTLNMLDMAARLGGTSGSRTVLVAFAFLSVGTAIKMALFPLHVWLPDAYAYAPSVVTAFLAATATKVSVYVLLRLVFTVFGSDFAFERLPLDALLMPFALGGIFIGSTVAIFQRDVKRMLAWSSVAQIGYMTIGISFATVNGLTGGIVHLFNHALIKGGLFLTMACVALRLGSVRIDDLHGLGRRMPLTAFTWVLGGLALIGVPATAGFVTKWYLVAAALETGWWEIAAALLLSSLLAVAYVWRFVEVAYFKPVPAGSHPVSEAPWTMLVPTWALIGGSIAFGVWTSFSTGVARRAAESLLAS